MWGNILTEVSYLQNFNMGFSNNKSDVLIHLTQWQYWWWFWFTFLWSLYYFLIARVFRYRTLKFNPRIATTLRPHGKWGDLLACAIPVTWCVNILLNSNFILKLIEWQSESSLFTLRVRAKQWYWIYKLDLRNITDVFSAPRNIGRNKWQSATFGDLQTAEDYLHILQIRAYNSWSKEFWTELNKKSLKKRKFKITSPVQSFKTQFVDNVLLTQYYNIINSNSLGMGVESAKHHRNTYFKNITEDYTDTTVDLVRRIVDNIHSIVRANQLHNNTLLPSFSQKLRSLRELDDYTQKNHPEYSILRIRKFTNTLGFSNDYVWNFKKNSQPHYKNSYKVIDLTTNWFYQNHRKILLTSGLDVTNTLLKIRQNNLSTIDTKINFNKLVFFDDFDDKKFLNQTFFYKWQQSPNVLKKTSYKNIVWFKKIKSLNSTKLFNKFFKQEVLVNYNWSTKNLLHHSDFDDETRLIRRNFGKSTPVRLLKCPSTDLFFKDSIENTNVTDIELFRFRFNKAKSTTAIKPIKPTVYLTFKQKRYNQRVNIALKKVNYLDKSDMVYKVYSGNPFLKDNAIIEENFGNPTKQYRMLKKAKTRVENVKVANWNRLLRSRRVLVLPAHINITVITNSFDVVHSWHIPGLGLKMDCLPGRATHHTLYIDNVGLYYGQCAEICGRYHHHMPIRVCALPFEHFLVWWHTFGLPKFLFAIDKDKVKLSSTKYFSRKFAW